MIHSCQVKNMTIGSIERLFTLMNTLEMIHLLLNDHAITLLILSVVIYESSFLKKPTVDQKEFLIAFKKRAEVHLKNVNVRKNTSMQFLQHSFNSIMYWNDSPICNYIWQRLHITYLSKRKSSHRNIGQTKNMLISIHSKDDMFALFINN